MSKTIFGASLVLILAVAACAQVEEVAEDVEDEFSGRTAVAQIQPLNNSGVTGTVTFEEVSGDYVLVDATVRGLETGKHGFHVHEGTSCENPGGHYNPLGHPHGSPMEPSTERHVGDLGNMVAEESVGEYEGVDRVISLEGDRSIIGHVVIVHAQEDQYIPQPSGEAGPMVGCGVIQLQE